MWKKHLRLDRSVSSPDALYEPSFVSSQLEAKSLSASAEQTSDEPRHRFLPDETLASTNVPRTGSSLSTLSGIRSRLSSSPGHPRTQDRRDDPLGLVVLHTAPNRTIDIIFIHGLGGTSLRTWCHNRDVDNLWPKHWLPDEVPTARVLTFGYNAHFSSKTEQAASNIGDFATDLLFRMKYGENSPERLGQVPIVVVAHSMGGLVFKKAFVQGHLNDEFRELVSMIKAVLFLATPHRGTDLAGTLNKVISSSIFGHSPKDYVTELARRSPTVDDLNEAFRHHASKLRMFSFYETLATAMGPVSTMIVDKPTAVMGYPTETPMPLTANHHDVCKFPNTTDPNYASVIGALRSVASTIVMVTQPDAPFKDDLQHLADLLGVDGPPEEDLSFGRSARKYGTLQSFLGSKEVDLWLNSNSGQILWAHAPPGAGKSTLCSSVIERLLEAGHHCSYFFFKNGQRGKESSCNMLRYIAYQTALQLPEFHRALVDLAKSGVKLSSADPLTVWGKLFSSNLANIGADKNLYWVLDGLDEVESCKSVVEILSRVGDFASHIHILAFSRPLPTINLAFQRARKKIDVIDMPLPDNRSDIRLMVAEEIDYLPSSEGFKAEVVEEITARSQGSFLWASLVTKRVVKCHRKEQVKRVLDSTPGGMQDLYDRMADAILELELGEDKALARILLTWAMYAKTPVTVEELLELYPTELGSIMDLDHTISQVCGQFVAVNPQRRVTLIHHSAREYLEKAKRRPFSLSSEQANGAMLSKCLEVLCDKGLRRKLRALKTPRFLTYASTAWASHLEGSAPDSNHALDALVRFFSGPYPLAWIQYLAMSGRLAEVIGTSRRLTAYVSMREKADADIGPTLHRTRDLCLLQAWAVDLLKLPAKFGRRLCQLPAAIYECIPMLCPTSSIIHQMFKENPAATLSVSRLPNEEWDDCLARVSRGLGRAQRLAVSPLYLAVTNDEPRGTLTVWDTELLTRRKSFSLAEHIWEIVFSASGSLLACYSLSKTFVWNVSDWSLAIRADNPHKERAIELRFDAHDALRVISEHKRVYKLRTHHTDASRWEQEDVALLEEPGTPEARSHGTPSCVSFNSDCTRIAVAYPTSILSIWIVDPPQMIARLETKSDSHTGTNKVVWHPSGAQVICIYGQIFKWSPGDDTYEGVKDQTGGDPHELACSPDGRVFATLDTKGSVKIYDVASMSLVYTLTSRDHISRICFSPDNLRFYDLRGSYCNVWEPNCLLRLADAASEQAHDTEDTADSFWSDTDNSPGTSVPFPASESHVESKPAIIAVEPGQDSTGLLIAHANHEGSISVYHSEAGKKYGIAKILFRMQVEHLAWSPECNRFAYSLANGATTVKAITIDNPGDGNRALSAESVYADKGSHTDRGRTRQLLFDCTSSRLLISGFKKCQVLSLPDGAVLTERQVGDNAEAVQWKQHPLKPERLLCFSTRSVATCTWDDLTRRSFMPLTVPAIPNADDDHPSNTTIDAILVSHSPHYLLLRTATKAHLRHRYRFAVLPTQGIYTRAVQTDTSTNTSPTTPQALPIPARLNDTSSINHALGILPDNRLVFVDHQFWVCTTQLPPPAPAPVPVPPTPLSQQPSHSGTAAAAATTGRVAAVGVTDFFPPGKVEVKRHFFLPQDWVTAQRLRLCRVLRDGTVLCPAKGEVAVLRARGLVSS